MAETNKIIRVDALRSALNAVRGKVYTKSETESKIDEKIGKIPELAPATESKLGGVKAGGVGISIAADGTISATGDAAVDPDALPLASKTKRGAVIIGDGVELVDGKITVSHPTRLSELTNDKSFQTKTEVESIAASKADERVNQVVDGAPAAFDTLKEIADALAGNDTVEGIITTLGKKADSDEVENLKEEIAGCVKTSDMEFVSAAEATEMVNTIFA